MLFAPELLITARQLTATGDHSAFYRASRAGHFVRLAHGVHMSTADWNALARDERPIARASALAVSRGRPVVFSHLSAAAIWGMPIIGRWPDRPDVVVAVERNERTGRDAVVHGEGDAGRVARVRGMLVTALPLTLIDIARSELTSRAVSMIDHALHHELVSPEELAEAASLRASSRGRARVRRALDWADPLSESVGESVSRVGMHLIGCPLPELQHEFRDHEGRMLTDFWWPSLRLAGEFDGEGKYLREGWRRPGESVAGAVLREKERENRIRALGPTVARWGWDVATNRHLLAAHLRRAGLSW